MDDAGWFDSRQAEVETLVTMGQLFVLDSEQMEHRGMQVADVDRVLGYVVAEFIQLRRTSARTSHRRRPSIR